MAMIDALLAELEQESLTTRRVLERVPQAHLSWKPHPKSMSLGQLALHVATVPGNVAEIAAVDTIPEPPAFVQPEATTASELVPSLVEMMDVLEENDSCDDVNPLPDPPVDPQRELTDWVSMHLDRIRLLRPMLIHAISEYEERPEVADFACRGRIDVHRHITEYVERLHELGLADRDADVAAAVTMLISSVMGDAMGRPMSPDSFPPLDEVARRYVRCFLRALGASTAR